MAAQHSTRRAAVLGSPISHSLSPALHRAAYASLGLSWTYDAIEVDEARLAAFIGALDDTWAGLSLTMPLKEAVIELLDEVDPIAQSTLSVNTVVPCQSGWRGANTDITGMVEALIQGGLEPEPTAGLVLGAGATARSALAALARLGAERVLLSARRPEAARALLPVAEGFGLPARVVPWEAGGGPSGLEGIGVTVSTVPGGAGAAWATFAAHCTGALLDAAYHPWPTPLAAAWSGRVIASGRDMLLWQAVEQVQLMTGMDAPVADMRAALPPA